MIAVWFALGAAALLPGAPLGTGVTVEGRFAPVGGTTIPPAVTYDLVKVPEGSHVRVMERVGQGGTTMELRVRGLLPDRAYGAHVHTRPCGAKPEDSGPHYQNVPDPVQPSTDPEYANPHNEVWLDFTTDERGSAAAVSRNTWRFRAGGARSVVIHEHHTDSAPGHAGMAGDRLACLSVDLDGGDRH